MLDRAIEKTKTHITISTGDINAKVDESREEEAVDRLGRGTMVEVIHEWIGAHKGSRC